MSEQKHYSFGSIEQYRNCVKVIRDWADHHQITPPTLKFHGTVKLHGTNASVVYNVATGEMYAQSRENVITITKDNAGFAMFLEQNKSQFKEMFDKIERQQQVMSDFQTPEKIIIFGEWCGGSIQKGVALNKLPKMFVMFSVKLIRNGVSQVQTEHINLGDTVEVSKWFSPNELKRLGSLEYIRNIEESKTFEVEVDFSKPEIAQNIFVELTNEVENECPFSASFGVSGVGEGIVWVCVSQAVFTAEGKHFNTESLCFKTKGAKHSDTKTKVIVEVDAEKIESVRVFVNSVLTDHRLEKMLDKLQQSGADAKDVKNTGEFLKLVAKDIEKEEMDVVVASGFIWKDIVGPLNRQARDWFLESLKTF